MVLAPARDERRIPARTAAASQSSSQPRPSSARRTIGIVVLTLVLGALLEARPLLTLAEGRPFGWQRTFLVAFAERLEGLSVRLGFDGPQRLLDRLVHPPEPGPHPQPAPTPTPTGPPSPTPTPTPPARRIPTAAAPLRIWIGGDSMSQSMGESLIRRSARTGLARARLEVRYSTGLTRPDFYDWTARFAALLKATRSPEALVVMLGANDAQGILTAAGAKTFGAAAWRAEYASRVDAAMRRLTAGGRTVYWVGQPIMRSAAFSAKMRILNAIYRTAAERNGVRYIDTWNLFADANGGYAAYLRDEAGRRTLMRAPDGIHLTRAGGDRLSRVVFAAIEADWQLGPR